MCAPSYGFQLILQNEVRIRLKQMVLQASWSEPRWRSLVSRSGVVGRSVDVLNGRLAGAEVSSPAHDLESLAGVWVAQVSERGGLQPADLVATVGPTHSGALTSAVSGPYGLGETHRSVRVRAVAAHSDAASCSRHPVLHQRRIRRERAMYVEAGRHH